MRFATLTLLGKNNTLRETLDRIYRHFRALRATELWEKTVTGGAAFLEIKWNNNLKRWHTHLHLLLEGRYLAQADLSRVWHGITGDSMIVDIRAVGDGPAAAGYVTKYVTKPLNSSFVNLPDQLDEAVMALRGKRLCLCFGSWYGTSLSEVEEDELFDAEAASPHWTSIGSLVDLRRQAFQGDARANLILATLTNRKTGGPIDDSS